MMSRCVVMSPYKFSVCDTTREDSYVGGGVVLQIKTPTVLAFVSKTFVLLAFCYRCTRGDVKFHSRCNVDSLPLFL